MSDWISVKDRKPPENKWILGWNAKQKHVLRFIKYDELDITHWMPLPDPPQHRETCDCEFPDIDIAWGCEHEYCKRCGNDMHER